MRRKASSLSGLFMPFHGERNAGLSCTVTAKTQNSNRFHSNADHTVTARKHGKQNAGFVGWGSNLPGRLTMVPAEEMTQSVSSGLIPQSVGRGFGNTVSFRPSRFHTVRKTPCACDS